MSDHGIIDLRSDTVTRPGAKMRAAMADAVVGDDVYGEDPTVNRLEERAAEIFGKEAGLFVPTGTMGNTISLKLLTRHGQEIVCESRCHILNYELSMMAWFAGCVARPIPAADGILSWEQISAQIRPVGPHAAPTGCVEIENTHNMAGGTVYPIAVIDEICDGAHAMGLPVHMDGARVFNAAAALGRPVREICAKPDTVMFCISKGLGAPAGSLVVGRKDAMAEGRRLRKRLGGGMRQVGVLAAPGLIALEEMPQRLHADHENARYLAEGLANIPGIQLDPAKVQTNIVIFDVTGTGLKSAEFSARLKAQGVLMNGINPREVRLVTHCDVNRKDCEQALAVISAAVRQAESGASPRSEQNSR